MPEPASIDELLRDIEESTVARASRRATSRIVAISVGLHLLVLSILLGVAGRVPPQFDRWFKTAEPVGPAAKGFLPQRATLAEFVSACAAPNDSTARELLDYVRLAIRKQGSMTTGLAALSPGDTSRVWVVTSDVVCRRAARLINASYHLPENRMRIVYLLRAGDVYLAADTALGKGRYGKTWVMDEALTRIEGW